MEVTSRKMVRVRGVSRIASVVCFGALLLGARSARADGAFPDSLGIMTPDALPHEIVLATNFGLVISVDDGQTWTWACESTASANGSLYQMGPSPRNRIYTVAAAGLAYTDDSACTWTLASGGSANLTVLDAFVDPTNSDRVLSIVSENGDAGATYEVLESSDAGTTLGTLRYTAAAGDHLSGIEIARSAPQTVYLTLTSGTNPLVPKLAQSTNGGTSFPTHDLSAMLGPGVTSIRLIAVDPQNPGTVFMRVASYNPDGGAQERIAVTTDGGASVTTPLALPGGNVQSFARLPNGHLLAGGVLGSTPVVYRSIDGGTTFQQLPTTPPFLKGLSARGGTVYGVADDVLDGYAIATSTDEGMTWTPVISYDQIQAIQTCVMQSCQNDCLMRADMGQWSQDFCAAAAPPPHDAGTVTDGATGGAGGHAATDASTADGAGGATPAKSSGCHCNVASSPAPAQLSGLALALAAVLARRRRR